VGWGVEIKQNLKCNFFSPDPFLLLGRLVHNPLNLNCVDYEIISNPFHKFAGCQNISSVYIAKCLENNFQGGVKQQASNVYQ
jgi:hypothetical protein